MLKLLLEQEDKKRMQKLNELQAEMAGGLFVLPSSVFRINEKRSFREQDHALTTKKKSAKQTSFCFT